MSAASPAPTGHILADSLAFDWRAQSFRADLIFILPVAICLVLGLSLGHPGAGLIAAGGAFTVGFGAKQHIDESRFLPMILAALGTGAATFLGMVAGHTNFILVLFAAGAGFVYGMLSLREAGVSWVGQQFIVFLLVASGFPFSPTAAAVRSSLVMAGGALQIILSSILLRLLHQLRTDLLSVARHLREEHHALRSSVEQAARSLIKRDTAPSAVPYAIRLAITLGVSTEIYRHFGFANGTDRRHLGRGHAGQLLSCPSHAHPAHSGSPDPALRLACLLAQQCELRSLHLVSYGLHRLSPGAQQSSRK
jgi:hypothetical protein